MSKPKEEIKIDGKKEAANLLSRLDTESRARILTGIAEKDPALAEALKKGLFSFEQVLELQSLDLQKVILSQPTRLFALALRGISDEVKNNFFAKLSPRQGAALREEIEAVGPSKLSDVQLAREKIAEKARELLTAP